MNHTFSVILTNACQYFNLPTLLRCEQVSKEWFTFMKNENIWKTSFKNFTYSPLTISDVKDIWLILEGNEDIISSGQYSNKKNPSIESQITALRKAEADLRTAKESNSEENPRKRKKITKYSEISLSQIQKVIESLSNKREQELNNNKKNKPIVSPPYWRHFFSDQYKLQKAHFYEDGFEPQLTDKFEEEKKVSQPFVNDDKDEDKARRLDGKRRTLKLMGHVRNFVQSRLNIILPNHVFIFWAFYIGQSEEERIDVHLSRLFDAFGYDGVSIFASESNDYQNNVRDVACVEAIPIFIANSHYCLWYEDIAKLPTKVVRTHIDGEYTKFVGFTCMDAIRWFYEKQWEYRNGDETQDSELKKISGYRKIIRQYGRTDRDRIGECYTQKYHHSGDPLLTTPNAQSMDCPSATIEQGLSEKLTFYFDNYCSNYWDEYGNDLTPEIRERLDKDEKELGSFTANAMRLLLTKDSALRIDWNGGMAENGRMDVLMPNVDDKQITEIIDEMKKAYIKMGRPANAAVVDSYIEAMKSPKDGVYRKQPIWNEIDKNTSTGF